MSKERHEIDPDNLADDKLYGTGEIANLCSVQVGTVRTWIREGKLPAIKIGRDHKVRRKDLLAFLNQKF